VKVAIDAQLAIGTATGIGEYTLGLVAALRAQGTEVVELSEPGLDPWRFDRRVFWDQVLLPQRARRSGAALLHCASGTAPLRSPIPFVVTVHDVAWLRSRVGERSYARYYFGRFSLERYRRASAIAVDSLFSLGELSEVLPDFDASRVRVVYPGVSDDFGRLQRRSGDGRTILAVGTVERRKNIEAVIKALPRVRDARLVSVGPYTPYQDECKRMAAEYGVSDRVEFRGYVDRKSVLELYASAAVVAVPSRYEGFGYAAAQALCCAVPVVVSDRSSLPEIVGAFGRVVAIDDVGAWGEALEAALRGDDDARAMAARSICVERFSWSTSAADAASMYALACA
jgi:glycosyltransferase involved in cell wall biosynthesis